MISLEPYIATPYIATQKNRIMKTLAPMHRKAVNQAAHAAAVRFEVEPRDRWIAELTEALDAGATFSEMQAKVVVLGTKP